VSRSGEVRILASIEAPEAIAKILSQLERTARSSTWPSCRSGRGRGGCNGAGGGRLPERGWGEKGTFRAGDQAGGGFRPRGLPGKARGRWTRAPQRASCTSYPLPGEPAASLLGDKLSEVAGD
jgi:hypothetical protein